jgi:hypothetical protein
MDERPPVWWGAANILNKESRTAVKVWYTSWGLGEVLTTPHRKNVSCYEMFTRVSVIVTGTFECGNEHSGSIKCIEFLD